MIDPNKVREAFAKIETEEGLDFGEVLGDLVEEEGDRLIFVNFDAAEFEKVTLRICELMEIVRQNALVRIPTDAEQSVEGGTWSAPLPGSEDDVRRAGEDTDVV